MDLPADEGVGPSSFGAGESASHVALVPLEPDESMKAWLLFEVENPSRPLQFNKSIMVQNVDSEPPKNPGLNPIIRNWHGTNLYVPQESHDGVVYGTIMGQMDSDAMLANQGTRTRFCFDCRGNELAVFIGGIDDRNGTGSISSIVIAEDGAMEESNTTFSVKASSTALTTTDVYHKRLCQYCKSWGPRRCDCSSARKNFTEDDLLGSFEAVRISLEEDTSDVPFWTEEFSMYTDQVFAKKSFNFRKVVQRRRENEVVRKVITEFSREYAVHDRGDVLDTARQAFAFLHYSSKEYKQLTFAGSSWWPVRDSDEQISNGVLIEELEHEFEAVSEEYQTGPSPSEPQKEVRNFLCPACPSDFKRKYEMTRHFRTVHLGERGFSGEFCYKKFIHKTHLRTHVVSVHIGVSEAFCPSCGKGFATKAKLNRHVSAVHEKKRSHVCEICAKKFFQRSDVKKHLKTHTLKLVSM
mmetsp:Transcript_17430/g.70648  ORF Transcript_17430/g.70648 Transcript_17430/m.70648 type:complete len:467 (-) Transcript_17430:1426-2826(-)|eukprot:CAMPEP_0113961812 /NCGR_PEP_ID=MMETSP0011_2-20120614/5542_1 /TAXON_ID=101924 /ORGANISM="Rhodosorus marinus" /LENGTH=466 /DNA_ID=CAMNT_0000973545 /DNA_START=323 /DNA_END=1723 /DNA_ORIENTATION=- /assembly_acc=CAM_ASM_000156